MNPLLEQFIHEGRDFLQGISEKLIALEDVPDSVELMTELFRLVHTLKGNSGLFDFPEMTRVLHAGEDLMDGVRDGRIAYSNVLADRLLEAMDFVGLLLDEIEHSGASDAGHAERSSDLAQSLRALIPVKNAGADVVMPAEPSSASAVGVLSFVQLTSIPESERMSAWREPISGTTLFWIDYRPDEECFFKGEDPFHQVRQAPGLIWGGVTARSPWPRLVELDCYRCQVDFHLFVAAERGEIDEFFRYTPEQVRVIPVDPIELVVPQGQPNGEMPYDDFVAEAMGMLDANDLAGLEGATRVALELLASGSWRSSALHWLLVILEKAPNRQDIMRPLLESINTLTPPDWSRVIAGCTAQVTEAAVVQAPAEVRRYAAGNPALSEEDHARLNAIFAAQGQILALPDTADWVRGRLRAVAATITACLNDLGEPAEEVEEALGAALIEGTAQPLREWLAAFLEGVAPATAELAAKPGLAVGMLAPRTSSVTPSPQASEHRAPDSAAAPGSESGAKFGRRADDALIGKVLKVDQAKVDRLMNLIGEMVVSKNSLPYLANRAENQFGVRELAREIKAQYAVINRIAEEMQDAIMQVRMTPVSFVFQRFPRLVRDTSRKLGKEVELVLEGEDTEADKNIVEALSDPLIHIVRNCLDHGLELPGQREAVGKPRAGRLIIRAGQESDHVLIEIIDDGRGIDPAIIKRKAYEKGMIDEATLERISDQEAINLVFAAGFSTAETISDLSGRGVGMDVVRNAIDKVGGTVTLTSEVGKGTTLRLSLPLSMAVTNVMIIESDRQIFGVPMDRVVETVRLPRADIRTIKRQKATVLRGSVVPLMSLNDLLAVPAEPLANAQDEFAALVVRVGREQVGLLVDEFREVVDVILKPLPGELGKLSCYAGTALMGDGSVLMVLNPKELF